MSCANTAVPASAMHRAINNLKPFFIFWCPFLMFEECRWGDSLLTVVFHSFAALKNSETNCRKNSWPEFRNSHTRHEWPRHRQCNHIVTVCDCLLGLQ